MTFSLKSWLLRAAVSEGKREEGLFLQQSRAFLEGRNTNPDRVGCPSSDFLKRLAQHEVAMDELRLWTNHLSSCGECYREFEYRKVSGDPVRAGVKNGIRRMMRRFRP
jgi:hypothetical protein